MTLWNLLKDILVAVLLALLISFVGIAWIDYDVPGAWPDLIGPSRGALKASPRCNAHTGRAGCWVPKKQAHGRSGQAHFADSNAVE